MAAPGPAEVQPFYLVMDVSWSMSLDGRIDAANRVVPAVVRALGHRPEPAGRVWFGLIDFADEARVRLPLCDIVAADPVPPELTVRGGTSFTAAFALLRREIRGDRARLAAAGRAVGRPTVFFVSDGGPTDDECAWRRVFASLTSRLGRLNVVPCGVGVAEADVLGSLVHPATGPERMALYLTRPGLGAVDPIAGVTAVLVFSMIESRIGRTVLPGPEQLPAGVVRYHLDDAG